jgi:hypothetical protein
MFQRAATREFLRKKESKGNENIQKIPVPLIPPVTIRKEKQMNKTNRKIEEEREKFIFPYQNKTRLTINTVPKKTSNIPKQGLKATVFAKPYSISINAAVTKKTVKLLSLRLNLFSIFNELSSLVLNFETSKGGLPQKAS